MTLLNSRLALIAAIVAWSACITLARAADTGSLRGLVEDTNGRAIASAHVTAVLGRSSFGAVSAADGSFTISSMPPGVYSINVTARGFQRLGGEIVEVVAGEPSEVILALSPESASAMATIGHVTVNGSHALSTASAPTTDLDPQDLAGRGVEQLSQILGDQIALTLTRQMGGAPGLPESASIPL